MPGQFAKDRFPAFGKAVPGENESQSLGRGRAANDSAVPKFRRPFRGARVRASSTWGRLPARTARRDKSEESDYNQGHHYSQRTVHSGQIFGFSSSGASKIGS
jgi:hypothetical protein